MDEAARLALNLDIPVSTRLRKLSQAFFNAQHGDKVDLMNDWEIGGTQNKWVCPSDRHLQLRAQLRSGWSVRTATARSPTNAKGAQGGITEAEQEQIRAVLAKAEASRISEQQRLGKMVDRLEKMRKRATGNGVTHCYICQTEFGLLASKSYAAMCSDCRKYVCQRNCGVETLDPSRQELVFLCKICSEARELWKKSGAWFYKEMPEFIKPDQLQQMNGNVMSPPAPKPSWVNSHPAADRTPSAGKRHLPTIPIEQPRSKSPRPRIQPSWVKEKVMSSMSVDDDDNSSEGEGNHLPGAPRKHHRQASERSRREANLARFALAASRITDSEDESSPESHASTRSTSPRRSLATPSSYDSCHKDLRQTDMAPLEDARSIDSGVVQSDHSNQQANLALSVSSLTPLTTAATEYNNKTPDDSGNRTFRMAQSASGHGLITPPPIPPRNSPAKVISRNPSIEIQNSLRKLSFSSGNSSKRTSASGDQAPSTSSISVPVVPEPVAPAFMSSPDDDSKRARRRAAILETIDTSRLRSIEAMDEEPETTSTTTAVAEEPKSSKDGSEPSDVDEPGATSRSRRMLWMSCFRVVAFKRKRTLGSIQFDLTYNSNEKKLTIHLIKAKNLKAMDSNGFSDPYVKLHLLPGNAKATKMTSKTIEKTLNPEWDEVLTYHGVTEEDRTKKTLRITVLDRDRIGSDFLGETRIALKKLPINETKKFNLYLEHQIPVQQSKEEQQERGKLLVGLQYNIQQGSLFVSIKRGAELLGMDSTGFSDPYCRVQLIPLSSKSHRQRTSIKKRTLNPEFNETLQFVVPFRELPRKTLKIGVYDHDLGSKDDYIGGIVLSTSSAGERGQQWQSCIDNPGQTFEAWHKLEPKEGD